MIEFQSLGPLWLEAVTFAAALAALLYAVHATRFQPLRVRVIVAFLRLLLLSFGLVLLHHPTWTHRVVVPKERKLAVFVDRSASMGAESEGGASRYQRAYEVLQNFDEKHGKIDLYEFDQTASEALTLDAKPERLSGNKTDYYTTLTQFFANKDDYESLLLLSDGHDLGRFSTLDPEQTRQWLERLGAPPINTLLVGDLSSGPEIAIHSIEAPSFSFVRAPLRIRATVLVRNLDDHATQVQLLEGEKIVKIQDLSLDPQGFGTVEFEVYPDSQGEHLYTLKVPPHHLEKNLANNEQQVLVDIGRDKISVLHIAGSITWDLQGLRAMFERDPLIDLTAFYIMRTRDHLQMGVDNRMIPNEEMALVPFPTEEIFDRQLFGFDVVVFHDFDSGTYFSDSYQARRLYQKLREFVTEHRGGLIVIGGPRTASGPSLALTPLAEILPLLPPAQHQPYEDRVFQPVLTPAGRQHPLMRRFDEKLQTFDGAMSRLTIQKDAEVLVRDPAGAPLLATAQRGNGRTLFLDTASSWKWRRDGLAAGGTGEAYYDFWSQAFKWAIADPALDQVRITPTKTTANPLAMDIDVLLRKRDYTPASGINATLSVTPLDGKSESISLPFSTNAKGAARVQFTAARAGYFRLEPVEAAWRALARPHTVFLGGSQDELRNLDLVPETLQRLANDSKGHFFPSIKSFDADKLERGEVRYQTIAQTQRLKLRNWIWCLPILLLIGAIEWAVRRSSHLA